MKTMKLQNEESSLNFSVLPGLILDAPQFSGYLFFNRPLCRVKRSPISIQ